jgi:hypothetical protein
VSDQPIFVVARPRFELAGVDWADWPNMAAAGVFAVLGAVILATFQDYGISWDEMLQNTYGQKLLTYYASGFQDEAVFDYANLYLYGGFFDLIAALFNSVSPFGEYETRHLLGGIFFLAGLIGAWRLANLLAGGRAALITLLCLALTPLLYGHGFINPKDSPLAWLVVWVIYFGCRILENPERTPPSVIVGFGVSLGLALGTRVIAFAFPAYVAAVLSFSIWVRNIRELRARTITHEVWQTARPLLLAAPIAILVMAIFWPWSVQAPFNIVGALEIFSDFVWRPLVLWSGALIPSSDLPAVYLTRLLFFQLPEYVIFGALAITIVGVRALRMRRLAVFADASGRQYLFLVMSFVVPVAAFMILRPVAYNGVRHFLFVVPPLVILASLGIDHALTWIATKGRVWVAAGWVLLVIGWGWQIDQMIRLHPYQYLSYNALIGGIPGAENRFELDYWGTSLAEASRGLVAFAAREHFPEAGATARVFVCGDRQSAQYFLPKNFQVTDRLQNADFYIGINDPPCRYHFDNPQKSIFQVQREGVTLSYVLDLRTPVPTEQQ